MKNGIKEGEGAFFRKNGDIFKGKLKNDNEYSGIHYINEENDFDFKRKRKIEKGSDAKEIEIFLELKDNELNKEIQIINYNREDLIQKETRERNIKLFLNISEKLNFNWKYRFICRNN